MLLSFLLLAFVIWMGADMHRLAQQELLWGVRPLLFLLAAWSAVVLCWMLLRERRQKAVSWRRLGLATATGVLLSLGFPALLPFPWLMFIAFIPLLILEKEIETLPANRKRAMLAYSYHAFVIWNILTTFWVANSALVAGIFAIFVNAFLMTLPLMAYQATKKILPKWSNWAFGVYWISFELLHYHWDLAWPWLTLGNGFAAVPATIQWYQFTGVFGGSAWILAMNVLLWKAWEQYQIEQKWPKPLMIRAVLGVVLPILLSLGIYFTYEEKENPIEVVVVQPNYEPHYQKFDIAEKEQVLRFIDLTKPLLTDQTDYVVFPETSFGYMETTALNNYPIIRQLKQGLIAYPNLKIVTGLNAYHDFGPGEEHTSATRKRQGADGKTIYFETYNLAAQLMVGNEETAIYKKSKLVPGPEIFPFKRFFPFMEPLVEKLDGTTAGLGTQKKRTPLPSPTAKIAPVICYESVFGDYFTGYIREGSQAVFIMTNDGWWDNTLGHRQHLYFASLRAIETRRSVARSANTGISAFINQRGDIVKATHYNEPIAIKASINLNDDITFYVRWGDMMARISLFLAALLFFNTISKGWLGRVSREKAPSEV